MLFIKFYYEKNPYNNVVSEHHAISNSDIQIPAKPSLYGILFMNLCFPKETVNTCNSSSSNSLICGGQFLNTMQVKFSS